MNMCERACSEGGGGLKRCNSERMEENSNKYVRMSSTSPCKRSMACPCRYHTGLSEKELEFVIMQREVQLLKHEEQMNPKVSRI